MAIGWDQFREPIGRYLAATSFGSWIAYEGYGLRTNVAELVAAAAVLRVECSRACMRAGRMLDRALLLGAIRASDLLLAHLIDRPALVAWLRRIESA